MRVYRFSPLPRPLLHPDGMHDDIRSDGGADPDRPIDPLGPPLGRLRCTKRRGNFIELVIRYTQRPLIGFPLESKASRVKCSDGRARRDESCRAGRRLRARKARARNRLARGSIFDRAARRGPGKTNCSYSSSKSSLRGQSRAGPLLRSARMVDREPGGREGGREYSFRRNRSFANPASGLGSAKL